MKSLFLGSALSGGLGLVIALFVKDEPPQGDRPQPRALVLSTLRDKRLWLFSIAALLYHMILFATANSFTSNIVKELGASGGGNIRLLRAVHGRFHDRRLVRRHQASPGLRRAADDVRLLLPARPIRPGVAAAR